MNLSLLIIVPLLTALALLFCRGLKQVRMVSFLGAAVQLVLSLVLLIAYWQQHQSSSPQMMFEYRLTWFRALGIQYHVGVDGISIAMILLTAFVVMAGVLVSWTQESWSKEFFFLLMLLSLGAYGFFISLD